MPIMATRPDTRIQSFGNVLAKPNFECNAENGLMIHGILAFLVTKIHPPCKQWQQQYPAGQEQWDQVGAQVGQRAQVAQQRSSLFGTPFFAIAALHQQWNYASCLKELFADAHALGFLHSAHGQYTAPHWRNYFPERQRHLFA
jgi:hypothetical protein